MTVLLQNHKILEKGNFNVLFLKSKYVQTYFFKQIETDVSRNFKFTYLFMQIVLEYI